MLQDTISTSPVCTPTRTSNPVTDLKGDETTVGGLVASPPDLMTGPEPCTGFPVKRRMDPSHVTQATQETYEAV